MQEPGKEAQESRRDWRGTFLAAMANYIDAGSIVAGASGLTLWVALFHLNSTAVGLIGAFSSNAISAGIGALIGGRICDLFGRKRIYQYDLLVYAFGLLWIIFAQSAWMLIVGYVLVGLTVGADVPASWTLIAETAPKDARGRMSGLAQVLWSCGPVGSLVLALALSPLGVLGTRLVFVHLLIIALVTWALRQRMVESPRWKAATERAGQAAKAAITFAGVRELFRGRYLGSVLMLIGMYGIWNLMAGTNGFYLPYILRTVGSESQATSVGIQCISFVLSGLGVALIFMTRVDRANHRLMLGVSATLQAVGMFLFVIFPVTLPVAIGYVVLIGFPGGFGQQPFFQLWSGELFPTLLRSTAQGFVFAVVRIALGLWSLVVPRLTTGATFHELALILTGFLVVSGVIGIVFAPAHTAGRSLEEIHSQTEARGPA